MRHRDGFVATIALAVSTLAMAAAVGSGAYGQAAGAEAHGIHALADTVACAVCPENAANAQMFAAAQEVKP